MAINSAEELKAILYGEYDGFADKRLKSLANDAPFIVDSRGPGDLDARKQLFLWFCQMFATVRGPNEVELWLRGGVPVSEGVTAAIVAMDGSVDGKEIHLSLNPGNVSELAAIEAEMASIIRRRYSVPAYKYVVPRTVESLGRLRAVLTTAWG